MMKRIIALLLALILTVGLLPTVALAADEVTATKMKPVIVEDSGDNTTFRKTISENDDGSYKVTLEAWATGKTIVEETKIPLDIVLVLDKSGSMKETFSTKSETIYRKIERSDFRYNEYYWNWSADNIGLWYKVGEKYYKVNVDRSYDARKVHFVYTYTYQDSNGQMQTIGTSTRRYRDPGYDFYRKEVVNSTTTKMDALKEAATSFATTVQRKAAEDKLEHRIAVVSYSTDAYIATGSNAESALVEVNKDTGLNTVKKAINKLEADGGTQIDLGIKKANEIFEANEIEEGKRARVVIAFTDGTPGLYGYWAADGRYGLNNFNTHKTANAAIQAAYSSINTYKASVYTIGIFDGADNATLPNYTKNAEVEWDDNKGKWEYVDKNVAAQAVANSNRFMHLVSSNYPTAKGMEDPGKINSELGENSFYLAASSAGELSEVFDAIGNTISTVTTTLNDKATIVDKVPSNFTISANAENISLKVANCIGENNGALTFATPEAAPEAVKAKRQGNTVLVNGFNFSDKWCGKENDAYRGQKLIVSFDITHNNYGGTQPTNDGACIKDASGESFIDVDNPSIPVKITEPSSTGASETKIYDGEGIDVIANIKAAADALVTGTNKGKNQFVTITVAVKDKDTTYTYTIPAGAESGSWDPTTPTLITGKDVNKYEYDLTITYTDATLRTDTTTPADPKTTSAKATYTINKRPVTLTSETASKSYDGTPLTKPEVTVTDYNDGKNVFNSEFTAAATGTITEPGGPVVNTITVTPKKEGALESNYEITKQEGNLTITQGDPTATELSLTGKFQKTLNSNTANVPRKSFELTITGTSDNTGKTTLSGTADIGTLTKQGDKYTGSAYFGFSSALKFSTDGIYKYKVQETKGNVAGMSYDTTAYELVIEVENKNGALEIKSATIGETDMKNAGPFTITNTFTAAELPLDPTTDPTTGEVTPKIVKKLRVTSGSAAPTADLPFTVAVYEGNAVDEAKRVATGTATIPANSPDETTVNFTGLATLVFPEAGRFTYTIHEDTGSTSGVRYDGYLYTMTVEVTKNTSDNSLSATCSFSYPLGEETVVANSITITNTYTEPKAPSVVSKKVVTTDAQFPAGLGTAIDEFKSIHKIKEVLYPTGDGTTNNTLEVPYGTDSVTLLYAITVNRGTESDKMDFDDNGATFVFAVGADVATGSHDHFDVTFNDGISTAVIYVAKTHTLLNFVGGKCTVENVISEEIKATTTVTEKDPDKLTINFADYVKKELTATGTKTASDVNFTVDVKEFKTVISSIQVEEEVNTYAGEQLLSTTLTAHFDSITGGETKTAPFNGSIVVEHAGTYSFELTEEDGQRTGVTYDDSTYKVYVYVKREGDKLVVGSFNIYKDGRSVAGETITFHNTIDTGKDDYYPIIIPTIINKDTGMLNKTDHFAYVIGYPDGTVHPNGQITRAEVATIFFRLLRDEVRDGAYTTSNSYSDVAYGKWYNNPISTMSALGIITGYPDGTFKPNKPITRAEFAAIAARFDETQSGKSATFSDVIGHWAAKEIGIAYYNDWIQGYPDGTFKPDQNITRAEAMTLINRVLERKPESPADLLTNMNKWTDNMDTSKWYYLDVQEATNSHGYTRKTFNYELWRQMLPDPDWSRYER